MRAIGARVGSVIVAAAWLVGCAGTAPSSAPGGTSTTSSTDTSAPPAPSASPLGPGPTSSAPATPPSPPSCQGVAIPRGDLPISDDGRTVTVDCGATRVRATAFADGVVRLRHEGAQPIADRPSHAVIAAASSPSAVVGATAEHAYVCAGPLLVAIARADCHVRATDASGAVVVEDAPGGGYFEDAATGERGLARVAAPGDRYLGFGERTGPLDKRGRAMTFWNTDAYVGAAGGWPPDADPLYQSIPFFVGLGAASVYGVFVDDTFRLAMDMAKTDPAAWRVTAAGGAIDEYLLAGPTPRDVVRRYAALTGTTPLPPRWTLGYHQSRWGYADAARVLQVAQGFRDRDLPADAIWLDIQHLDGFRSFTWDPARFPDPDGLVAALAQRGFKAVSIVDPGLKVDPSWDAYAEGLAKGLFLTRSGAPYVGEVWPGAAVFPDFSKPEARAFWAGLVPRTVGRGVRGLWIDMNEPSNFTGAPGGTVPDDCAAAGDGLPTTMAELHNVYALDEARATYEGMRAAAPDRRPFLLTRAGYAGIQRYAAVWTGDAPSTFATLGETLPMLLGLGLSGVPFVGSDVGGYSGSPSPELFARWMELGSISPFCRDHVATNTPDQEPWALGQEPLDITRAVIGSRYRLLPYWYSLFAEAAHTGDPPLRPLLYEHPGDASVAAIDDEAMIGPGLLVAPVVKEGATSRTVTLPAGRWFEVASGAVVEGPASFEVAAPLGALPTYAREGAIVPRAPLRMWSDQAPVDLLEIDAWPAEAATSFPLYEDDGDSPAFEKGAYSRVTLSAKRTKTGMTLSASPREGSFEPHRR
jgi:alpha-glucosidase